MINIYFFKNKQQLQSLFIAILLTLFCTYNFAQTKSIILGRPTDTSITASILFDQNVNYYLEYGTSSGTYSNTTSIYNNIANTPDEIDLHNLTVDTRYFYRMKYKLTSATTYTATPEYTFHTQRAKDSTFTFTVEADEHLYDKKGVKSIYQICLNNQLKDKPDFMLSLGDIFGDDHEWSTITSGALDTLHKDYRPFLGSICHSVPFYIALGNHEGENDYYYNHTPGANLCVWGTQWRKFYYPNPYPNGFYSGNTDNEPYGIGNPENYYAWNWGNSLFIVLDVYRNQNDTSDKPQKWDWSLGLPQYTWLKNTLETSTAKHKFVFCHHIRGQGRGGVTNAKLYEWGGYDGANGNKYSFPTQRPGWAKPIHKLFVDNGVNVFFQGHDHVYAHELLDGIAYQAVPMPSDSTYEIGKLANAGAYLSDTLDGTGHIRVTVSADCVKVDYIKAFLPADTGGTKHNGDVAFSYTVGTCNLLPVSLKTFTGYKNAEKNILKWITATETNNHHFDIERSLDGVSFEKIATVKGNGNTTNETNYSYIDNLTEQKVYYYRLKQVDNNGNVKLSSIVVLYAKQNNLDVMIYPNPAKDKINIQYPESIKNHQTKLINMFGQVVLESTVNTIDINKLPLGIYIVNIETEKGTINQKIIKQ